jgi:hypothetical protein
LLLNLLLLLLVSIRPSLVLLGRRNIILIIIQSNRWTTHRLLRLLL